MKIKIKSLFFILIGSIPLFYQFFTLENYAEIPYLQYIPMLIIALLSLFLVKPSVLFKGNKKIITPVLISFVILPMISLNIGNFSIQTEVFNMILRVVFLVSILGVIAYVENADDFRKLTKYLLIGNSIILTFVLLSNINDILNPYYYSWLYGNRVERLNYGFSHPNTAGMYIYSQIILLGFQYFLTRRKILVPLVFVYSIFLLPTGSRTGTICTLITFAVFAFFRFLKKYPIKMKFSLLAFTSIGVLFSVIAYDWGGLWSNTSGRDYNSAYNFRYLVNHDKLLFGVGPINIADLMDYAPYFQMTDNWFLITTMTFGLVSTIVFTFYVFLYFKKMLVHALSNQQSIYIWAFSYMFGILMYSIFENVLYVPGNALSVVFWVVLLGFTKLESYEFVEVKVHKESRRKLKKYRLTW